MARKTMRAISFAMTTAAVKARRKSVTRREWADEYADKFNAGDILWSIDKVYYHHGQRFGIIRLTEKPYKETHRNIPESDWEAEGFAYMEENNLLLDEDLTCAQKWKEWRELWPHAESWVIRFEILWIEGEELPPDLRDYFPKAA